MRSNQTINTFFSCRRFAVWNSHPTYYTLNINKNNQWIAKKKVNKKLSAAAIRTFKRCTEKIGVLSRIVAISGKMWQVKKALIAKYPGTADDVKSGFISLI